MFEPLKPSLAPLALRLALATIFISHGYLKIAVTGGDHWLSSDILSPTIQLIVAWGEMIGGIALAIGFLTRLAAVGIGVIMIGAVAMIMGDRDFLYLGRVIKGGDSKQHGFDFTQVGFEYNAAILMMCVALFIIGSGVLSVDHLLFGRRKLRQTAAAPLQPAGKMA